MGVVEKLSHPYKLTHKITKNEKGFLLCVMGFLERNEKNIFKISREFF